MRKDLHHNVKTSPAINPAAAITGNGTTTGTIIDTADYDSLEFAFQSGVITDGSFACSLEHGDDSGLSDAAAVGAADLLGSNPTFAATDDNKCKRVGYRVGAKRYVRAKAVQSGATSGGFLACQAIQGGPKVAPVAE